MARFAVPGKAVWFAVACGFAWSCIAIANAPQSVFPRIALARVEMFADASELPAESVRSIVAEPIETALATLAHVRATRTFATTGRVEIEVDFDPATDPADDRRTVEGALDRLRDRLPISNVEVVVEGPEAEPVVTYAIVSRGTNQAELLRRVRAATRTLFARTPQLGRLTLIGGPHDAYDVTLDATRLARLGVSPTDVVRAIAAANGPHAAGTIERKGERLRVVSGGSLTDSADLAGVGVDVSRGTSVALTALGHITSTEEPSGTQSSFDATHAVMLNAYPLADGDAVTLAREVATRMARLSASLPSDTRISIAWDQTRLIRASQQALRFEMCLGAAIALVVIGAFLRSFALMVIAGVVLPIALAFTVAALVGAGLRLDLMTLGGLAIAIGLIVDEIIVVVEAIARALETTEDGDRRAVVARAVERIARPLVASTVANIVVFLPLALLGGVPGFFFRALAITLSFALAISIALSLTLTPSFARAVRPRRARRVRTTRLEDACGAAVRFAGRHATIVACVALVVVAVSGVMLSRMPAEFLPAVDEGQFEVTYALPPGTSPADADRLATIFERTIMLDGSVAHVARLSGIDTNGYLATPPDAGTIRVTLEDGKHPSFDVIADRLRERLLGFDPNVAVEIHQLLEDQVNDLSGAPEAVQISLYGPDQQTLAANAGKIADAIVPVRGLVDVFDGVTYESRSIAATPYDLSTSPSANFETDLAARIGGIVATEIETDGGPIPVNVRVAGGTPLARIARFAKPEVTSTVTEENGARFVRVTAGLEGGDLTGTAAAIQQRIAPIVAGLPPGYRVEIGGAIVAQRTALAEFATIFSIAFVLVFFVLVATFDSFRLPLIVLATLPTMPIGVAIALWSTKTPLNVASFMGMLLLAGLVVRAGILLVDSARRRMRDGVTPQDAMEFAARERLRPILMTATATLGAVAPLALGFGVGAEFERPLAIAVIGGIVTSTALTLVIVPALFVTFARRIET